ncbi:pentapeptide repeat-containing protein [Arthrobacter rhombi]|uniref:pentapeptide repeat-containing protein n=1 Tax=Arthrobacter rhombi TaxID=71253 RepID=UPI003FD6428B
MNFMGSIRSIKTKLSTIFLRARKFIRRTPLSAAALLTVVVALLLAVGGWYLIGFSLIGFWSWGIGLGDDLRVEAVRIVLTMIAGIGGIVALVIAYRKQRGTEEGRFMANLENAARQMGAIEPTVQFAGIYALASLADESEKERKQKCVDVLCGYLRLPYTATNEVSTLREVVEKHTSFDTKSGVGQEQCYTHQLRPAEREVRLTIIRTITERLQKDTPNTWSNLVLDFRGAVFDGGDFSKAHFNSHVYFSAAQFDKGSTVHFFKAQFNKGSTVHFSEAQFNKGSTVLFSGAEFNKGSTVYFSEAEFNKGSTVHFSEAQFNKGNTVHFSKAQSNKGNTVHFSEAQFNGGLVDFSLPASWETPPLVPWTHDAPPEGVQPNNWPPEVLSGGQASSDS